MSTVPTVNYGWLVPVPGTEVDLWGAILNNAFGVTGATLPTIDSTVKLVENKADAALPKAGGTMTGKLNTQAAIAGNAGLNTGVGTNPTAPIDGDLWSTVDGVFARVNGTILNLSSTTGAVDGEWNFDASTAAADPGAGDIRFNSATMALVTQVFISETTSLGNDAASGLAKIQVGDSVYVQQGSNSANFISGSVSSAPTDNGTWWTIPLTLVNSGGVPPTANQDMFVRVSHPSTNPAYAPIASPAFTGNPTAPTPTAGDNDTSLATTAFVTGGIATAVAPLATTVALNSAFTTVTENAQVGTAYTLALTDAGKMVTMNNSGAIILTIPTNASVAFPLGTRIDISQLGAGQVSVSPTGITLQSNSTKRKLTGQFSGATLWKQGTNTWMLFGDIAA